MSLNRTLVIEKTGEKMLQGWKLLSLHCPICNTALLSKKLEMFCVGCDMSVISEAEYDLDSKFNSPTVEIPTIQLDSPYKLHENGEESNSLVDQDCDVGFVSNVEFQASRKKMDEVSKMLGQKMLNGWALLGEICPSSNCSGTPLMSQKEGPMVCVCCSAEYIRGSHGELVASVSGTKHAHFDPSIDGGSNANIPSDVNISSTLHDNKKSSLGTKTIMESTVEDISVLISDKLLAGWSLLDDSCQSPTCRGEVPLMRNKRGEKVCVKCAVTVSPATIISGKHVKLPDENSNTSPTSTIGKRNRGGGIYSSHLSVDHHPPASPPPAPENDLNQLLYGSRGRYSPHHHPHSERKTTTGSDDIIIHGDIDVDLGDLPYSEINNQRLPQSSGSRGNNAHTLLPSPLLPSSTSSTSPTDTISMTLQVLQNKMRDLTKELDIASHPTVIRELADTLRSLADTWISVRKLLE